MSSFLPRDTCWILCWNWIISGIWASIRRLYMGSTGILSFPHRPLSSVISFQGFHANSAPRLHFPLVKSRPSDPGVAWQVSPVITFLSETIQFADSALPLFSHVHFGEYACFSGRAVLLAVGWEGSEVCTCECTEHYITALWKCMLLTTVTWSSSHQCSPPVASSLSCGDLCGGDETKRWRETNVFKCGTPVIACVIITLLQEMVSSEVGLIIPAPESMTSFGSGLPW